MKRVLRTFEEIMSDHLKERITRVVCKNAIPCRRYHRGMPYTHVTTLVYQNCEQQFIYKQNRLFHITRKQKKQKHKTSSSSYQPTAHPWVGFALASFGHLFTK
ncbi:hypothetical protein HanRHA438_Chr15g0713381 [Helianthus annuus]|nr:hypothetical protein HanRHA438_Chr15g0713381 [Helianthus annuus]